MTPLKFDQKKNDSITVTNLNANEKKPVRKLVEDISLKKIDDLKLVEMGEDV